MRTTLTLDDEVATELKEIAYRSGVSFKAAVNETLRSGLAARRAPPDTKPYRVRPASLGGPSPGVDLDKALRIADALEDEGIARKLELRK